MEPTANLEIYGVSHISTSASALWKIVTFRFTFGYRLDAIQLEHGIPGQRDGTNVAISKILAVVGEQ